MSCSTQYTMESRIDYNKYTEFQLWPCGLRHYLVLQIVTKFPPKPRCHSPAKLHSITQRYRKNRESKKSINFKQSKALP